MQLYIILMNLTDQGIRTVKDSTQLIAEAKNAFEKKGGVVKGVYLTMGQWDYLAICEAPSDEIAVDFILGLGATGNVRTHTIKAFLPEVVSEFKFSF
ncbi:MAG TPA: GYD domain-containing protein [Syntrophales bacterium]|nr:GYD domain-containing protein [Syntrophales bacterium]